MRNVILGAKMDTLYHTCMYIIYPLPSIKIQKVAGIASINSPLHSKAPTHLRRFWRLLEGDFFLLKFQWWRKMDKHLHLVCGVTVIFPLYANKKLVTPIFVLTQPDSVCSYLRHLIAKRVISATDLSPL